MSEREYMTYDVVIVGGGPAGLSAAIRIKQRATEAGQEVSVCILEKGSEIGAHILSGAVIDPVSLDELLPDWRESDCPLLQVPVTENQHWLLSKNGKTALPESLLPPFMHNKGCYSGSLGALCRWLADRAEALGVDIFPGFCAAEILYDEDGSVRGVATGDKGVAHDGNHKPDYQPGLELHARYTFFAEGARGHLTKQLKVRFDLEKESDPQTYGLGLKELWDIDPSQHVPGRVIHTQGWPLTDAYGGGFLYHQAGGQVALGFVVGLGYSNPYLSPFEEFQRWKQHPAIREVLKGGKRVAYGARAINEGGWQAIPTLTMPGATLIGCAAGFVNVPRIKGTHTAMKSAMLAADAAFDAIALDRKGDELTAFTESLRSSFVAKELKMVRNAGPALSHFGNIFGTLVAGIDLWMRYFGVCLPFTLHHKADHTTLRYKEKSERIDYPKPDGVISFDKLSSVYLSGTNHQEDQPCHLQLKDPEIPTNDNLLLYDEPAQRYCPAGVYEVLVGENGKPVFQINAQNCVHCKTCDIKDPAQNIDWVVPEGGDGPRYPNM